MESRDGRNALRATEGEVLFEIEIRSRL